MTNTYKTPPRYLCRRSCGFAAFFPTLSPEFASISIFHARGPAIFILLFVRLKIYPINMSDYEFHLNM